MDARHQQSMDQLENAMKNEAIIEALLRAGAKIDSKNDEGLGVWQIAEIVGARMN
jgi:hypothetical protein